MLDCCMAERARALFALLLLLTPPSDPLLETPVPLAYACKLLLSLPVPGSSGKNQLVTSSIQYTGTFATLIMCIFILLCWWFVHGELTMPSLVDSGCMVRRALLTSSSRLLRAAIPWTRNHPHMQYVSSSPGGPRHTQSCRWTTTSTRCCDPMRAPRTVLARRILVMHGI